MNRQEAGLLLIVRRKGLYRFADALAARPHVVHRVHAVFPRLTGEELRDAIKSEIRKKGDDLVGNMASQGTTPRRFTDLIGSLCDLTSGSGDKGTPIVYIQGYFDNYTTD